MYITYVKRACLHTCLLGLYCVWTFALMTLSYFLWQNFRVCSHWKITWKDWGEKKMVLRETICVKCRIETASYFWSVWTKPNFVILIVLCRKDFSFSGRELCWSEKLEAWLTHDFSPLPPLHLVWSLIKKQKRMKATFHLLALHFVFTYSKQKHLKLLFQSSLRISQSLKVVL